MKKMTLPQEFLVNGLGRVFLGPESSDLVWGDLFGLQSPE